MQQTTHPYRAVWETGDLQAWEDALAPEVVLHSPIIMSPFRGREAAIELFSVLLESISDFEIALEATDSDQHVFFWSAIASGRRIEGCDRVTMDATGRISEITVLVRPLVSIGAFAAAIGPPLAGRRSRMRAVIARIMLAPLRVMLALADAVSPRLVQR